MVDATNSVALNALQLRSPDPAQNIESIQAAAISREPVQFTQAPFISPVVSIDTRFDTAVLLLRNSEDGEVLDQIPSENNLLREQRIQSQDIASRDLQTLQNEQSSSPQPNDSASVRSRQDIDNFNTRTESVSSEREIADTAGAASSLDAIQTLSAAASQSTGQVGGTVNISA